MIDSGHKLWRVSPSTFLLWLIPDPKGKTGKKMTQSEAQATGAAFSSKITTRPPAPNLADLPPQQVCDKNSKRHYFKRLLSLLTSNIMYDIDIVAATVYTMPRREALPVTIWKWERELSPDVRGITAKSCTGYKMLINATLPPEEKQKTIRHELAHIRCGHFDQAADLELMESEADTLAAADRRDLHEIIAEMGARLIERS